MSFFPSSLLLRVVVSVLLAVLLAELVLGVLRRLRRRSPIVAGLVRRARVPLVVSLVCVALTWVLLSAPVDLQDELLLGVRLVLVVSGAWLLGALLFTTEEVLVRSHDVSVPDNLRARRVRTQVNLARRATTGVLVVLALGMVLLQFESVRAVGAGVFASAGILSVVVGLAAQTTLGNVFASLQLAFTNSLRVDDVVVVEGEWGNVEEIGLSIVVRVWDGRRLILPATRFTQEPFQNWTRHEAAVLGTVEMDVDWGTPLGLMREEFERLMPTLDLWDHAVAVLQTTEATGSFVQVRLLVSAKDGPSLFDLRCVVREHMVEWLRDEHPEGLPRVRYSEGVTASPSGARGRTPRGSSSGSRVFSGSSEAAARSEDLTGSVRIPRRP